MGMPLVPPKNCGNDKTGQVENIDLLASRGHTSRRISLLTDIKPAFINKRLIDNNLYFVILILSLQI